MWDADKFYRDVLSKLFSQDTRGKMEAAVQGATDFWNNQNQTLFSIHQCEMEWQAWQVGNVIAPPYLNARRQDIPRLYGCSY